MSVCVGNFTSLSHVIFQILPTDSCRQVLNDEAVVCPGRWSVPGRRIVATSARLSRRAEIGAAIIAAIAGTAASGRSTAPCTRRSFGTLHRHSFSTQFLSIQLVNGIVSITVIFKFHKAVTVFDENFAKFAIAAEESFNIAFLHSVGKSTNVNASSHGINYDLTSTIL